MKRLLFGLAILSLVVTSCGDDDDPIYDPQPDQTCRLNATAGLKGQYKTPAELDSLLDVICGPQSNK